MTDQQALTLIRFRPVHLSLLLEYLHQLGADTRMRFAPHPFTQEALNDLFIRQSFRYEGHIACIHDQIVAYNIIRRGWPVYDQPRLKLYGLQADDRTDALFAPSVADAWQGKGIGSQLWDFTITRLQQQGFRRLLLWGGVQSSNTRALRYYTKKGFRQLGSFEYHGLNHDMLLEW
jgi:ribosomal protein S18 acetylase RimI-like enzyme